MEEKTEDKYVSDNPNQTLNLSKLEDKISLSFDYEMNNAKIDDSDENEKGKFLYLDEEKNAYNEVNFNSFFDKLLPVPKIIQTNPKKAKYASSVYDADFEELEEQDKNDNLKKANFVKRLVSKQKRRFQDSHFDLDMSYITERFIAMGFPSTGMETLYRNSVEEITEFFNTKYNDEVKFYNLCLEKDRIYTKNAFPNSKVGLFPANDHNPCPIKLILEFCIDICIYLIKNPKGVAAVHCKAGKGRTGVMSCAYLIFSGLCDKSEKAFRYYARIRTKDNTGVTIASQRRYIRYFEAFLKANFYPPYYKLIPKIIVSQFSFLFDSSKVLKINNILQSFQKESSYFISKNKFKIKGIKVGPLPHGKQLKIKVCNFVDSKFKLENKFLEEAFKFNMHENSYYEKHFKPELIVYSDIKINIKKDMNFYLWVNFYYSTLELIRMFNNEYGEQNYKIKSPSDIRFSSLVTVKKEKKKNKKINVLTTNNTIHNKYYEENYLYDIIQHMNQNTDLNELIEKINVNPEKEKFDKKNLCIVINSSEFDKFNEIKDYKDFELLIFYSLADS